MLDKKISYCMHALNRTRSKIEKNEIDDKFLNYNLIFCDNKFDMLT